MEKPKKKELALTAPAPLKSDKMTQTPTEFPGRHVSSDLFECPHCLERFVFRYNFNRHKGTVHHISSASLRQFQCEICMEDFTQESSLLNHNERFHSNELTHLCDICHKGYSSRKSLKRHLLIHKERPFKCPGCPKGFINPEQLKDHQLVHMDTTCLRVIKEHPCKLCSDVFEWRHLLKEHVKLTHCEKPARYKCGDCGKMFGTKEATKQHARVHFDKKFVCKLCGDGFILECGLKSHMNAHLRQKKIYVQQRRIQSEVQVRKNVSEEVDEVSEDGLSDTEDDQAVTKAKDDEEVTEEEDVETATDEDSDNMINDLYIPNSENVISVSMNEDPMPSPNDIEKVFNFKELGIIGINDSGDILYAKDKVKVEVEEVEVETVAEGESGIVNNASSMTEPNLENIVNIVSMNELPFVNADDIVDNFFHVDDIEMIEANTGDIVIPKDINAEIDKLEEMEEVKVVTEGDSINMNKDSYISKPNSENVVSLNEASSVNPNTVVSGETEACVDVDVIINVDELYMSNTEDVVYACRFCSSVCTDLTSLVKHEVIHIVDEKIFVCSCCSEGFPEVDGLMEHLKLGCRR